MVFTVLVETIIKYTIFDRNKAYHEVQPLAIKSDTFNFTIDLSVELESTKKNS